MELLLKKGLTPEAMREAFRELREQHPDVSIRKVEDRDSHVLVSLDVPEGTREADVDRLVVSRWEMQLRIAEEKNKLLTDHSRTVTELAMAAVAAGVSVRVGGTDMQDRSIHGPVTVTGSQVSSLTGDASHNTQTMTQGMGDSAVQLAAALAKLEEAIRASRELNELEKLHAKQQVETVTVAAKTPAEASWRSAAAGAFGKLLTLVGKAPDLVKLAEAAEKAWAMVGKGLGLS